MWNRPVLTRLRKDNCSKLKASLDYNVSSGPKSNSVRPFLKIKSQSRPEDVAQLVEYLVACKRSKVPSLELQIMAMWQENQKFKVIFSYFHPV